MENKYEVIAEERINKNTRLYTLVDFKTKNDYSCIIEEDSNNVKVLADDLANIYDIGEALFQHDLEIFKLLPKYMITPNMANEYNNYYPGKGNSYFKNEEEYNLAYKEEEQRINSLPKKEKKLVK